MTENSIKQFKTVDVTGPHGPTVAMMIAVDIDAPASALAFVSTIAEQFKVQRMLAPPETSMLLVTLIGDLSAAAFAARWKAIQHADAVLNAFMSTMVIADVVQGTPSGEQRSTASLLHEHA